MSFLINKDTGHQVLSSMTGIKTEYAASSLSYLAVSVQALYNGQYKVASAAALCSLSALVISGTNSCTPKDVRMLNKLSS